MADFDTAARQEAERRYPAPEADADRLTYPREALRDGKRGAFEAGAHWGAEAALAEVAALADDMSDELDMLRAEAGPVALSYANCTAMDLRRIRAILARTEQTGADR